jgi:alpha-glucosidase (family GH31 glycosyl hydrolase)
LSTHGRYVWCDHPLAFQFTGKSLKAASKFGPVESGQHGSTLKEAYLALSRKHFPPTGSTPHSLLFTRPQYNTWIELMYDQNESDVLAYARAIRAHGFPPGVLMIDDNWQEDYGLWTFKARAFKDPREMIRQLHDMDFKVMLWVCPFVSADSAVYRELRGKGFLVRDSKSHDRPAMIEWWNGTSAAVDLLDPMASKWFVEQLTHLRNEYAVDGFKFDGGDAEHFLKASSAADAPHPNAFSEAYGRIGLQFPLNEYRACWKLGGQPLAQRLRDKRHSWNDLQDLIPGIIAQGLMGYAYTCPDMIGGGEYSSFVDLKQVDQQLIVRSAQCQALMPMMQFSVAPWRVLDAEHLRHCVKAAELHTSMGDEILSLAKGSAQTGEPIVRPLEYEFPNQGYAAVVDQFMLGSDIMVAPMLQKDSVRRRVIVPPGHWHGDDGSTLKGPTSVEIDAPLDRLPWFRRKSPELSAGS